ncbi:hypothetical protein [Sphingopyxis sp.]|uniref:hypothetical protein n=1 Tax=Sphingopyxis sp. TaxID=1908224 RepID=UPI003D0CED6C
MNYPNNSVAFQIDEGEVKTIRQSEWSRLLCYLWLNRHRWVTVLEIVCELRTSEVPARLSQLRNKHGVLVESKQGTGRKKLYRLDPSVLVVEGVCNG